MHHISSRRWALVLAPMMFVAACSSSTSGGSGSGSGSGGGSGSGSGSGSGGGSSGGIPCSFSEDNASAQPGAWCPAGLAHAWACTSSTYPESSCQKQTTGPLAVCCPDALCVRAVSGFDGTCSGTPATPHAYDCDPQAAAPTGCVGAPTSLSVTHCCP